MDLASKNSCCYTDTIFYPKRQITQAWCTRDNVITRGMQPLLSKGSWQVSSRHGHPSASATWGSRVQHWCSCEGSVGTETRLQPTFAPATQALSCPAALRTKQCTSDPPGQAALVRDKQGQWLRLGKAQINPSELYCHSQ